MTSAERQGWVVMNVTLGQEGDLVNGQIERKYVSVAEAEAMTGLSRWSFRKWCYEGRIASSKCGTRLLIPVEEVDRLIAEGMRPRQDNVA